MTAHNDRDAYAETRAQFANSDEPGTWADVTDWLCDMTKPAVVALVVAIALGVPATVHFLFQLFHRSAG